MRPYRFTGLFVFVLCSSLSNPRTSQAAAPTLLPHQGRVTVAGVPFTGTGQFKFALVDGTGTTSYWSNDGTSSGASEPTAAVSVAVTHGIYSVMLGDTTLTGMSTPVTPQVLDHAAVYLRIWFNDGNHGTQLLVPDARLGSVGYAMLAATVENGSVTANHLAAGLASTANAANALVQRDANGDFGARTVTLQGNLALPGTSEDGASGMITLNGTPALQMTQVTSNSFVGGAGSLGITGAYNTGIGFGALASNTVGNLNTAQGYQALYSNTGGSYNTAVGSGALYSNAIGSQNTATGDYALYANTAGNYNTGTGGGALFANTTGSANTAAGFQSLRSNTTGNENSAAGFEALYSNTTGEANTAHGFEALYFNINGSFNSASGERSLLFNTGGHANTGTGSQSLLSNTFGGNNTANGYQALFSNSTGNQNTATGSGAMYSSTIGDLNTASGADSLYSNTSGSLNTANGDEALFANTIGSENTASGASALFLNTTGSLNTGMGRFALLRNSTGNNNVALGAFAGQNLTSGNNNIYILNPGITTEDNTIRIGTKGTHTSTFLAGVHGATASSGVAVYVNTDGRLGTLTSSARFKEDIRAMEDSSESILELQPVTYRYRRELDAKGTRQFGLVAEDVEKVNPDLVARDADGNAYTVRYDAVNAMLLNEFLKEHRRVQQLEKALEDQNSRLAALERQLSQRKGTSDENP